ncbi:MAG: alpha-2-macroglobulin [Candidatus Hatepunaea meridiana]|nr:alpha-2-macroglobulin [Candidatus Hatepunaea meridiana]
MKTSSAIRITATLFLTLLISCTSDKSSVEITDFHPQKGTTRQTNITIIFSQDIMPEDSIEVLHDIDKTSPVIFEPSFPGRYKWISPNTLRFLPTQWLKPSTDYKAKVLPKVVGAKDLRLKGQTEFTFHTPYLKISNVDYSSELVPDTPSKSTLEITIQFNEEVDPDECSNRITLQITEGEDKGRLKFLMVNTSSTKYICLQTEPISIGKEGGTLLVKVKAGLTCVDGAVPLREEFEKSIHFLGRIPLTIDRINAGQLGGNSWIDVVFSTPVPANKAKDYIEIEPETKLNITEHGNRLRLTGKFQPGQKFIVTLLKGLQANNGFRLKEEFVQGVTIKDLEPRISFTAPGSYLTRAGLKNVELEVTNIERIHIEVEKIYENNLVHFLKRGSRRRSINNVGRRIFEQDIDIDIQSNRQNKVTVNFAEFLQNHKTGLFRLVVRQYDRYWRKDSKIVMLTDMGLIAKRTDDELSVWVLLTTNLEPLNGVKVIVWSSNNQEIVAARTNAEGRAVLPVPEHLQEEFTPYIITASKGDDFCYLLFDNSSISSADFDVDGRPHLTRGYEAFLYTDRGVYRTGDKANIAAITRGVNISVPPSFPVKLEVRGPDGRIFSEQQVRTQDAGMVEFKLDIPKYAKTGKYRANLFAASKEPIGGIDFSVEEFMPDRIKVKVTTDKQSYSAGDEIEINIAAEMLFGPPAADRQVEVKCVFKPVPFLPDGWMTYTFGNDYKSKKEVESDRVEDKLDSDGKASFTLTVPSKLQPPAAMKGEAQVTVKETGGRAVTAYTAFDVHAYPFYVGIKREKKGYGEVGTQEKFSVITLSPDGKPIPVKKLSSVITRIRYNSVLKRDSNGRMRYVSERTEERIQGYKISTDGSPQTVTFLPEEYGRYKLHILDQKTISSTYIEFYVSGWGYSPWSMEHPDRIDLTLDSDKYNVNDNAKVLIKAPFGGKLLLTVEREKVLYSKLITLDGNTADISLPMLKSYRPNVYVTATIVRTPGSEDEHLPTRAYGVAPLFVESDNKRLNITLGVDEIVRPNQPLEIALQVDRSVNSTFVTVAAVDEGILQLTDFTTPDPNSLFYGKKRLDVNTYDIFAQLLPDVEAAEIHSSPSGGRAEAVRQAHLSPGSAVRVKPVSFWSGILPVDSRGRATIKFDLPQFNGRLRVMALAVAGDEFGAIDDYVTVSDPIVLTPTFPRFINSGDKFDVPIMIYNGTGRKGEFEIKLEVDGPVRVYYNMIDKNGDSQKVTIDDGSEALLIFSIEAERTIGQVDFRLTSEGAGSSALYEVEVPLLPPSPPISLTGAGSLSADKDTTFTIPGNWVSGTTTFSLNLTSFPALKFAGGLQKLLRYPYGCIEQTTSQAFPLLYFREVAEVAEPDMFAGNAPEYFIGEAINKIVSMQRSDGSFSYWPHGYRYSDWSSIYASHFLVEADKAGYSIPKRVLKGCRKFLRKVARADDRFFRDREYGYYGYYPHYRLRAQAYAVYVLSLMNKPEKGTMHYLLDEWQNKMSSDSRALLAGAFALSGDISTAMTLLPTSFKPQDEPRERGGSFSSSIRTNAIILNVLSEVAPQHNGVPNLVNYLTKEISKYRWLTTQEVAWALMGLGKILRIEGTPDYTGELYVNGKKKADFTTNPYTLSDSTLGGKEIKLALKGEGRCYYFWEARGIPVGQTFREEDKGIEVRRRYLNTNGKEIDLNKIKHGEMIVAEINIYSSQQKVENLIIDDRLPACFEIENPRLESRATLSWLPKDKDTLIPDYMDIRDERLLLFADIPKGQRLKYYYALRVVTRGSFTLPPIAAECMYDPTLRSVASSGVLEVVK